MSERRQLYREEAFRRRGRSEPIDGLLRITAPHQWVFLLLLGAALIGVAAWGVFGSVERGLTAACLLTADGRGEGLGAVAALAAEDARRLEPGMAARVSSDFLDDSLDAEVREIERRANPEDDHLATHQVRLTLLDAAPSISHAGDACSVRIVIREEAPVRLIGTAVRE